MIVRKVPDHNLHMQRNAAHAQVCYRSPTDYSDLPLKKKLTSNNGAMRTESKKTANMTILDPHPALSSLYIEYNTHPAL